jgi:Flp pilus assembly pilin Flp
MKLSTKSQRNAGVAMTEYLILLALVAIASLVMTIAFGKQVKHVFQASATALGGGAAVKTAYTAPEALNSDMGTFTTGSKADGQGSGGGDN